MRLHNIIIVLSIFIICSCSVQKRHYKSGYYVSLSMQQKRASLHDQQIKQKRASLHDHQIKQQRASLHARQREQKRPAASVSHYDEPAKQKSAPAPGALYGNTTDTSPNSDAHSNTVLPDPAAAPQDLDASATGKLSAN